MEEIEKEKRGKEDARRKVEQLESVLDRVGRGELPLPGRVYGTPSRTGTPDPAMDGMMGLSPTVAMASKAQRAGKTFTEVYADYVRLQDDYAKKSAEYDHMDRTLSEVLAQIEERVRFTHIPMLR
jgi:nucleoprotein TPR